MTSETDCRLGTALSLAAAILLLPINARVLLGGGAPSVTCPLPFPLIWIVALEPWWLVVAIPSIAFWAYWP